MVCQLRPAVFGEPKRKKKKKNNNKKKKKKHLSIPRHLSLFPPFLFLLILRFLFPIHHFVPSSSPFGLKVK